MPRNHGLVLSTIWSDPDWVALTGDAQRLYLLLLSQPKLTLIGLLDYLPSRWARMAADTTLDSIEAAIGELEASRFVLVDHDTDELLIRTLVKHDITTVQKNQNLLRGLWNAWANIQSRQLRLEALRHIPASVWASDRCQPHPEADQIRRSGQLEPAVQTSSSDLQLPPPSTYHPPPGTRTADSKQPGNSRGDGPSEAAAVDNSRLTTEERQLRLGDAIDLLVDRELERNPTRGGSRKRHAAAVRRGKLGDHHQAGHQALIDDPTLSAELLADLLEPPGAQTPTASRGRADDDGYQRAQRARHQQDQALHDRSMDVPVDPNAAARVRGLRASAHLPTGAA